MLLQCCMFFMNIIGFIMLQHYNRMMINTYILYCIHTYNMYTINNHMIYLLVYMLQYNFQEKFINII